MLDDMIANLGRRLMSGEVAEPKSLMLEIQTMEAEARNMQERIAFLTGRPHVPLDGCLLAAPTYNGGRHAR